MVLIVFGHWLLSCVTFHDGSFGLQDPLADLILRGEVPDGSTVTVEDGDGALKLSVG